MSKNALRIAQPGQNPVNHPGLSTPLRDIFAFFERPSFVPRILDFDTMLAEGAPMPTHRAQQTSVKRGLTTFHRPVSAAEIDGAGVPSDGFGR